MKKRTLCLSLIFVIILSNILSILSFAGDSQNYLNEIVPKLQSYVSSLVKSTNNSKIILMTAKNIDLATDDQYQLLHNTLQNKFPENEIFDVYINSSGLVVIPEKEIKYPQDDETKYCQEDIDFKTKLDKLGVKNISIVNEEKNIRLLPQYYNYVVYCIYKMYNKYFYLTDKHINNVNNNLFSSIEIGEVRKEKSVIGEFVSEEDKIILSPSLFSIDNISDQEKTKIFIEYTISHEMGHAIELNLCKKVFKDLNLNNISQRGLEKLGQVYFCGGDTKVATQIKNSVLLKMNAPTDEQGRKEFVKNNLSEYANTNDQEFFADAVAYGSWADPSRNKEISKLVDEEIKNIIKGQGEVYQKIKDSAIKFLKDNNIT